MKKEKKSTPIKLLWGVMTKKNKANFFWLMGLCLISSIAILIPTQMLSMIISKLAGEKVIFCGITIPDSLGYIPLICIGGAATFFMRAVRLFYKNQIELLVKRVVCNLKCESYSWLIAPRKNMDLKMTEGDAAYRMNEGTQYIIDVVASLFKEIIPKILSALLAFIYICLLDIKSCPIAVAGIILVIVCVVVRAKVEKNISKRMEVTKSVVTNSIVNSISNLPIINLYKSMSYERAVFKEKVDTYYGQEKKYLKLRLFYWMFAILFEVVCTYGIILLCAIRTFEGTMLVGSIVIVANYVAQLFSPVQDIGVFTSKWVQCKVKMERLVELKAEDKELLPLKGFEKKNIDSVEFKNVNVQNGDVFMIKDVNMRFEKGKMTALYGESGCGKTTLLKVLCGLCEKLSGDIIVNDNETLPSAYTLVDDMSVVLQSAYIFNRDVKMNILYPNVEENKSSKKVIKDFGIERLYSRKYNEKKQQDLEKMLSGGEKRRICITRGLIRPAKIYIFDEPTNDLDNENVERVISHIEELKKHAIVIAVTHDKRLLDRADKLIRVENRVMLNFSTEEA